MEILTDQEAKDVTDYLLCEALPTQADCILVFGCRNIAPAQRAAQLYLEDRAPLIIVSGGHNRVSGMLEATTYERVLLQTGIPSEAILVEGQATNTLENVQYSAVLLEADVGWEDIRSVLGVTRWYHSRRALMTMKAELPEGMPLYMAVTETPSISIEHWHRDRESLMTVLQEYRKIRRYREEGMIEEIERMGAHFG